jgi:hypothetical protein
MIDNLSNRKAKPGNYSNNFESFSLEETEDNNVMILNAKTDIQYFPLKSGSAIKLNKSTIESLLNGEYINYL